MSDWRLDVSCSIFLSCSFLGWVIESAFRSIKERQGFVNAGFLKGPVVPIYGFGALMICLVDDILRDFPFPLRVATFALLCSTLEYCVGFLFESLFKLRLWDYTGKKFNLQGRICVSFTVIWAAFSAIFIAFIRPILETAIASFLSLPATSWVPSILCFMMAIDAGLSAGELSGISSFIKELRRKLNVLDIEDLRSVAFGVTRRLILAFPNTKRTIARLFATELLSRSEKDGNKGYIAKALMVILYQSATIEDLSDQEFFSTIKDLARDPAVKKMSTILHHNASTLEHSLTVAQVSYYLAKGFGLDEVSTARGALLHDFFLYGWRDARRTHHASRHPRIALENARARFNLNPIEEDIILTHMWPITKPFYSFRESFLVSCVDKVVSTKEVMLMLRIATNKQTAPARTPLRKAKREHIPLGHEDALTEEGIRCSSE